MQNSKIKQKIIVEVTLIFVLVVDFSSCATCSCWPKTLLFVSGVPFDFSFSSKSSLFFACLSSLCFRILGLDSFRKINATIIAIPEIVPAMYMGKWLFTWARTPPNAGPTINEKEPQASKRDKNLFRSSAGVISVITLSLIVLLLYYACTKIWDPANSPVNALHKIRTHIVLDIPWKREPTISILWQTHTKAWTKQW